MVVVMVVEQGGGVSVSVSAGVIASAGVVGLGLVVGLVVVVGTGVVVGAGVVGGHEDGRSGSTDRTISRQGVQLKGGVCVGGGGVVSFGER